MVQINHLLGIKKLFIENQPRKLDLPQKEISLLEQGGGLDTVSFSSNKSEKFADVRAELDKNVPDRTTTIEEKEKALSYIERMLKCDDITPEMKNYWTNKKDTIEMEIQAIKNEQQTGKDSIYQDVVEEYNNFVQQYWCDNYPEERNNTLEFLDSEEYGLTFYNTCISYLNRILACNDLPEDERTNFEQEINNWNAEKQSRLGEINWHKQNYNMKTESFSDVFKEMNNNIPENPTTVEEKKLAAMYIKRMVLCDDIPADKKAYWTNKQNILEMECRAMSNEQYMGNNEKWKDVAKDFSFFSNLYWVENVLNNKFGLDNLAFDDAQEYYNTVRRTMITYCDRILAYSDLPEDKREYYSDLKNGFKCDLNYYAAQQNEYNKANNQKTESFYDVFAEFDRNVPDRTTTINEKQFALSYIERMLSCDDIPNAEYWQDKRDMIEKELETMQKIEIN